VTLIMGLLENMLLFLKIFSNFVILPSVLLIPDPVPGVQKTAYYTNCRPTILPPGTACGVDGGVCWVPAGNTCDINYGVSGKYVTIPQIFNHFMILPSVLLISDPAPGVQKTAYYTNCRTTTNVGTACANTNYWCSPASSIMGCDITYGIVGQVTILAKGLRKGSQIMCTPAALGISPDPLPGKIGSCYYSNCF